MSGTTDEFLKHNCLYWLSTHAEHLNAIDTPDPDAKARYEIMCGALVWPDEIRPDTPIYANWSLRELWAYRTHSMLNEVEPDNDYWAQCVTLFPNWIGFLPERRKLTPELFAEYRRGKISLVRCLRKVEQETCGEK